MKPMKPVTVEDCNLPEMKFPIWGSIKCDGYRCAEDYNQPLTNSLKPIENVYIYNILKKFYVEGLDGEILLRNLENPELPGTHSFNEVQSAVTSFEGEPDFVYWVFDKWNETCDFDERLKRLTVLFQSIPEEAKSFIKLLPQVLINNLEEWRAFEKWCLDNDYEGAMGRSLVGKYKFGRSTLKEHYLLRRKPFVTEECRIIGFFEKMTNTNEAYKDELGRTKRSSAKAGKVKAGTLGGFIGYNKKWGEIRLGIGKLTHKEAQYIFDHFEEYRNSIATFKYQAFGSLKKPRILTFQHFRNQADMTAEQLELL